MKWEKNTNRDEGYVEEAAIIGRQNKQPFNKERKKKEKNSKVYTNDSAIN